MKTQQPPRPHHALSLLALAMLGLAGACGTVGGLGQDIQSAGDSTSDAIADATGESRVQDKGSVEGQGANQSPSR